MTDIHEIDDKAFEHLFQDVAPVEDDGFTDSISRRVRRPIWIRRAGLCLIAGAAIALIAGPLGVATGALGDSLAMLAMNWNDPEWLMQHQGTLIAAVTTISAPLAIRWLEN